MLSCALIDRARFPSEILSGIETWPEGELHTETRARGVALHFEPNLIRVVHPWKDFVALVRLTRFIARGRYDVVHTHASKAGILGRIAAFVARTPVVIHTAHGWGFHRKQPRPVYWFYVTVERWCARLCRALVVVGEATRRDALALGIGRPEQYHLIRSGIEIEAYRDVAVSRVEMRSRLGLPLDAFVVGSVGRLAPQKAPLDLLAAFEHLAARQPNAHLVLVGDGAQREEVVGSIAERGMQGRIHLLGLRRDVPELLRAFDVFAIASHWEGLPRVFPQAMAAGLPIVATDIDGAKDAVVEGETGFLVPIGDTAALGERLLSLARDPLRACEMGARARERVDEFSARRMVDQLEALYEGLTLAHRGRA
jgi:glycosyltransferase involved in cell wall biosynthesis